VVSFRPRSSLPHKRLSLNTLGSIQFSPSPCLRLILSSSSYLRLGLPSERSPLRFATKMSCVSFYMSYTLIHRINQIIVSGVETTVLMTILMAIILIMKDPTPLSHTRGVKGKLHFLNRSIRKNSFKLRSPLSTVEEAAVPITLEG